MMERSATSPTLHDESATSPEPRKMIRLGPRASILLVLIATAITLLLLVIPIPPARHHRLLTALLNLGHVPLFAILAWLVFEIWGRSVGTLIGLIAIVFFGEWIQIWAPGRTADWSDAEHGVVGIAIAWLLSMRVSRALMIGFVIALLAFPMARAIPEIGDVIRGWKEFPILARFEHGSTLGRWKTHGATLDRRVNSAGMPIGTLTLNHEDEYPGAELVPIVTDWQKADRLVIEFSVDRPLHLFVTIRDQRSEIGYAERFSGDKSFDAGRHSWEFTVSELQKTPGGVPLDLGRIDSINLFAEAKDAGAVVHLERVKLILSQNAK
jgi:hypothetical protein